MDWTDPLQILRKKWFEVPGGTSRISTIDLAKISDQELLDIWQNNRNESTTGSYFDVRGWYHSLYTDVLKNKKMMDVGSGFGIDGITFASLGAKVTFVDIAESNLEIIKRLCDVMGLDNVDYLYLEEFESLEKLDHDYDVIWCQGSMINLPFHIASEEAKYLLSHLKTGGRWIELAYPEERWINEGKMPLDKWGEKTDGGAPWMEWYDLEKILKRLEPAKFDVILSFNFHNDDFNWFDLLRVE